MVLLYPGKSLGILPALKSDAIFLLSRMYRSAAGSRWFFVSEDWTPEAEMLDDWG